MAVLASELRSCPQYQLSWFVSSLSTLDSSGSKLILKKAFKIVEVKIRADFCNF